MRFEVEWMFCAFRVALYLMPCELSYVQWSCVEQQINGGGGAFHGMGVEESCLLETQFIVVKM